MRATFLTHYFPPEVGAPQTRIAELTAGLQRCGVDVTVHTGFPHYPDGHVPEPYRIRPLQRERTTGGVRIVRSAVYPAPNRGFARRLAGHLSLSASAVASAPLTGPADIVVVESPPLFTAVAGVAYARVKRAPLVLHVSDLWPASAVALGALRDRRAIAVAERLETLAYAGAAAIVAPTEGIAAALERHRAARGKVVRIGPSVDLGRFAGIGPPGDEQPLRVLYAGTVGMAQGVDTLVEAARLAGPRAVRVELAGGGAELDAVRARLAGAAVDNVTAYGTVPAGRVPGLYGRAHAGAVLLRDRPLFEGAIPTKLLECLAAGRPVLLSARGEAAALVQRFDAGIVVPPENPRALAEAFAALASPEARRAYGARAGAAAASFDRARAVDRWLELLQRARR